jgi:radical SAM superfamily enzyme YgiQ (UPF0313 family)
MTTVDYTAELGRPQVLSADGQDHRGRGDSSTRVLLSSVFGPFAQDDQYGSRTINPMELWHNQVTRVQGPFSLRMFHRSWGLMLMQANIDAPCLCLDFPSLERFTEELRTNEFDLIGISAIIPNLGKVQEMCRLIREHQPNAQIVIGGHISNLPALLERTGADWVVRGDGVRWMREYIGQDADAPLKHPQIWSAIGRRCLGVRLAHDPGAMAATLIPSVGCPVGCNFCSTSAMFGGKGRCVDFYRSAEELFAVMCQLEESMKTRSFFVMDENFLLRRDRAMELLRLMRENDKAWALYVFSSARAIRQYDIEDLVSLGVSWLWMGLEGKDSRYDKLSGVDSVKLVETLQQHGIRVLGSSIIGLEEHTPENIDAAIEYAVSHASDAHQFMLYTPAPGTELYAEHEASGTLLDEQEADLADIHGQLKFNFRHAGIPAGQEGEMLLRAFETDFRTHGPSTIRMIRTTLNGYQRYARHADPRVRRRFDFEAEGLWSIFAGAVWATRRWFRDNPKVYAEMDELLGRIYREFGLKSRLVGPLIGRFLLRSLRREDRRLRAGRTYEPPTFYERNERVEGDLPCVQSVSGLAGRAVAAGG